MIVYKYYSSEYQDSVKSGEVFLNTFENIRAFDDANLIGDKNEGLVRTGMNFNLKPEDPDYKAFADILKSGGIRVHGKVPLSVVNGEFEHKTNNVYMYCASKVRNDDYWRSKGYDKCLKIKAFDIFRRLIGETLHQQGIKTRGNSRTCFYESNINSVTNTDYKKQKVPSFYRKTVVHEDQNEVRAIYTPLDNNPVIPRIVKINISQIAEFLY